MKELMTDELLAINGGTVMTPSLINALVRGMNTFLDMGRSLGSAIKRALTGSSCPV